MSKPVKNLITDTYKKRFGDLEGAVLIDIRGIDSGTNTKLRGSLAKKMVKITVIKNSLAKRAFGGTRLEAMGKLLDGPTAMVYGGESVVTVARELVEQIKTMESVKIKGAVMDGLVFTGDEVAKTLSKYPTRGEAQAQVIQVFLGPAAQVIGAFTSAGNNIAGILKTLEEKLEKGEAIAKIA